MADKMVAVSPGLPPWLLAPWVSSPSSHQRRDTFFYLMTTANT